ncbi:MAG: response regulator transcription factor [Anaerolineales bacterium]|jgi:two-component system response regulator NreC
MDEISIVLADDHPIVRQGLRTLFDAENNIRVVGEASDGKEAISLVEELAPDILVLDWMMPGYSGLEVTRELVKRANKTKVLILSMYASEIYVLDALRAGARGYVPKDSPEEILLQAIDEVAAGDIYLAPPLTKRAIEVYAERAKRSKTEFSEDDRLYLLSPREREILHLILESHTNNEIAERLSISPRTVHTHRANLMRKLQVENQTELFNFAMNAGLLPQKGGVD